MSASAATISVVAVIPAISFETSKSSFHRRTHLVQQPWPILRPRRNAAVQLVHRRRLHRLGRMSLNAELTTPRITGDCTQSEPRVRGRIARIADQPHRCDALAEKPTSDVTDEPPAQTHALILAQQIDLVQLAAVLGMVAARALGEADQSHSCDRVRLLQPVLRLPTLNQADSAAISRDRSPLAVRSSCRDASARVARPSKG